MSKNAIVLTLLCLAFLAFSIAVYTIGTAGKPEHNMNAQAAEGLALYRKHNCTACHQLYGLGGYRGPDITNVVSSNGKGPDYVRGILKNGLGQMPNLGLQDAEVDALVSFLKHADKSGKFPGPKPAINPFGNISPDTL